MLSSNLVVTLFSRNATQPELVQLRSRKLMSGGNLFGKCTRVAISSDADTDTLLKITHQTCMDTVKIIQCNDSET